MSNINGLLTILKKDKELLAILISSVASGIVLAACVIMASAMFM